MCVVYGVLLNLCEKNKGITFGFILYRVRRMCANCVEVSKIFISPTIENADKVSRESDFLWLF